jgi:ketosteroid isomerase-like protein
MSEQSVEIVRKVITAFWRRPAPDWETLNKLVHPDHELHSLVEAMEGGHAPGREGGRDFRERMDETGDWSVEIEDVREADDGRVVALLRWRIRPKRADRTLEQRRATIFTLRGRKVVRTDIYATWPEALEAVGLEK